MKNKRTTKAELLLNGVDAPISIIKFDSSNMSKKEVLNEINRQFSQKLGFRYEEKTVKK
jgi:hypothetical protein